MKIYLSTTDYRARDRVDVRYGIFAPSEDLERWMGVHRHRWSAGAIFEEAVLRRYLDVYLLEMRDSYVANRAQWQELLSSTELTLVCVCESALTCHRAVLGAYILPKLGGSFEGERVLRKREDLHDHTCHAIGCEAKVPPERLMCFKHWKMVPRDLQREVWEWYREGQCYDMRVSAEYLSAAKRAVGAVRAIEQERRGT